MFKFRTDLCLVVLIVLAFSGGCGVKGPPRPPAVPRPPQVTDLKAEMDGDRASLTWTVPTSRDIPVEGAMIFRADTPITRADCMKCPVTFHQTADVKIGSEDAEKGRMAYSETLEQGYRYIYKIILYNPKGISGEYSNTVTVFY
jgi:hypothetical protein